MTTSSSECFCAVYSEKQRKNELSFGGELQMERSKRKITQVMNWCLFTLCLTNIRTAQLVQTGTYHLT